MVAQNSENSKYSHLSEHDIQQMIRSVETAYDNAIAVRDFDAAARLCTESIALQARLEVLQAQRGHTGAQAFQAARERGGK